jgi:PAS domain S-box-containing protein
MGSEERTREQLVTELAALRQRIEALGASEAIHVRELEALRESQSIMRAIIEGTDDIVFAKDTQGRYVMVNAAFARIVQRPVEDIVGKDDAALFPPSVACRLVENDRLVLTTGETKTFEEVGISRGTTRVYLSTKGVRRDAQGNVIGLVGISREITERKRAEEALRFTQFAIDHASDAAFWMGPDARFIYVNEAACRSLGYTRDELLSMTVHDIDPNFPAERWSKHWQEIKQRRSLTFESRHRTKDGRVFPVEITTNYLEFNGQEYHCAFARDISERKRLEAQLRQAQKMEAIGTLAGGIAHEFNNILAAILGFTELTLYEVPQGSVASCNLQEILAAGQRAKRLIQQILAFSSRREPQRTRVKLHLLVQETLTLLRASLPSTIAIQQHIDRDVGTILADPTQMQQVLMSLCANAEYAMRETGGVLEIRLDAVEVDAACAAAHLDLHPGPYVRLTVRDTGQGMQPEVLARIFEPFYTTKEVGEGSGMGLAIVHGIIASHGGAITVESTPGCGTTFVLYLPRVIEVATSEASSQESAVQGARRILFVEDEDALARLGQAMLARLGYDVEVYTSSREALEAFRAAPQRFDLVITDQTMPSMTGEVLARELRRIRPDIPVILCTGFSHVMDAEKARAMGIDAFLMKPLVARDLSLAIRRVLRQ